MKSVLGRSLAFSLLMIFLMYLARVTLKTDLYISDIGGIQSFLGVFGTLYGIMAAFVVFEVWSEYNTTQKLIEQEATGIEKLYGMTLYFRDKSLNKVMAEAIKKYLDLAIASFVNLGKGERHEASSKAFSMVADAIKGIKFDDDHDQSIFGIVVNHYNDLAQVRSDRINQCLTRLPSLLKAFLYISSGIALLSFIIMPFNNMYYGFIATGFLAFILAMVFQLVEDLDNPFEGYWNITPEPFERTLKRIEKD